MKFTSKGFLSVIIFLISPFFAWSDQIETQISADATVERDEILIAEGNVVVQHGNNKITAKALKFNQKTRN